MSYSTRNTIIILVTIFLVLAFGYLYPKFVLEPKIEVLNTDLVSKQKDLASKKEISVQFPILNKKYKQALQIIENYDKVLYPSSNPDEVFDFLNKVNAFGGFKMSYDYAFKDSVPNNDYGILESSVNGIGDYNGFIDFINRIEHSEFLNKINSLNITQANNNEELSLIRFSFNIESYYQKKSNITQKEYPKIILNKNLSSHNPFYPLIEPSLKSNTAGLTDVRSSKIIGITKSRVFLKNQSNQIVTLKEGDAVFLGKLTSIDVKNRTASFSLNLGGILEVITLEAIK